MSLLVEGEKWAEGLSILCPYCGADHDATDAGLLDDTFEWPCDSCGREFAIERIVSVEFVSRRLPEVKDGQLPLFAAGEE